MRLILKNIKELLTLDKAHEKDGRNLKPEDKGIQKAISLVCENGKISQISSYEQIEINSSSDKILDCEGFCVTPEVVDSHTHLVFGGDRSFEYSMRLDGASYEEIANAGGGILHTTKKTNKQTRETLFEIARKRIEAIH
ncbi:MAG: imidazolonepropionase, partial [Halobacteriovoraceae bacterium]|nr:imidazolonepropionase [Halobacteriovoraceae bacterium]